MTEPLDVDRGALRVPLLVVAIAIVAGMHAIDALPVGVYYDDALYVILGKSLSLGQGYRYLNLPGAPEATHYPPGYPALLALLWRISPEFPGNVALFKTANALLLGGVAYATYRFADSVLGWHRGLSAMGAIAATATIPALVLSSGVMSETLFLVILIPLLRFAERSITRDDLRAAVALGAWTGAAFYVRSQAAALVPAAVVAYLLARRPRAALVFATVAVAMTIPWALWVHIHDPALASPLRGSYGSYLGWFTDGLSTGGIGLIRATVHQNLVTIAAIIARSFSLTQNVVVDAITVTAVLVLVVAGTVAFATKARATILFLAFYFAVVIVWPFSPLRFLWGVWPLLVLLLIEGARTLLVRRPDSRVSRRLRVGGIVAAAVTLIGALVFNVRGYRYDWWATVARSIAPRIQPQLQWTVARTAPDDVLAVEDEGAVYLYTGRRAVPVNTFTASQYLAPRASGQDARNLSEVLRLFGPRYVIAWAYPTLRATQLLTQSRPPLLVLIDSSAGPQGARIYRRVFH